jgi:hypothetical protein
MSNTYVEFWLEHWRLRQLVFLAVLALIGGGSVEAAPNLAQGMPYVYSPPALYDLTRDEGDATQLTDGKLAPDTMWMSRQAVGWLASATPIEIEIDLQDVKPVGRVCLRSARRAEAGVSFPRRVDVFASADHEHYGWIGNLMAGQEAGEGPYLAKNFCSDVMRRDARYIRLLVAPKGAYFFTDEVEVWPPAEAGPTKGSEANRSAPLALSELKAFALEHQVVSRMAEGLDQRPARTTPSSVPTGGLRNVMRGLEDKSGALGLERLASLEREMWQAVRQERSTAGHVLEVWLADPWRLATPIDAAPSLSAAEEIDMPQGGHAAITLAVEHAEEQPLRVSATAEALGATKDALRLSLFAVAMVTRADGVRQGDPLLPLSNGAFEVASGESRQLWIDVAAPGGTTGRYTVHVRLEAAIGGRPVSRVLDIPVRVWAVAPPPLPPSTVVWGYLDSPPIRGLSKAAAADMLAHGVTTAVLPAVDIPWPKPGVPATGNSIGDYRKSEEVMEVLKGHRQYLFFLGFNSDSSNRTFGRRHPFLSDAWKALFTDWIKEWSARLKQSGIGYDAFALYPVDEPHKGAEAEALIAVARLIKTADPRIRVYTTLDRPEILSDDMLKSIDIFQLNGPALTPTVVSKLKERGKQVWAYATVGGGKAGNPASFYRAQAWEAFALGASGFGFWAYADVGQSGTAWNDTDDVRPDYAVIYEGHPGIISSKRWEAWREGVQDFALLSAALANAHTETERKAVKTLAAEGQQALGDFAKFAKIRRKLFELASARGTGNPQQ